MFLRKEALECWRIAPKGEDSRYGLHGIRVLPDGGTVATDGHMLVHFSPAKSSDGDYPNVGDVKAGGPALEPFTLPTDACKASSASIRVQFLMNLPVKLSFRKVSFGVNWIPCSLKC